MDLIFDSDPRPHCPLCRLPIKEGDRHQVWEFTAAAEVGITGQIVCHVSLPVFQPRRLAMITGLTG